MKSMVRSRSTVNFEVEVTPCISEVFIGFSGVASPRCLTSRGPSHRWNGCARCTFLALLLGTTPQHSGPGHGKKGPDRNRLPAARGPDSPHRVAERGCRDPQWPAWLAGDCHGNLLLQSTELVYSGTEIRLL